MFPQPQSMEQAGLGIMTGSRRAFTLAYFALKTLCSRLWDYLLSILLVLSLSILAKLLAFNVLLCVKCSVPRPSDPVGECLLKFCTLTASLVSPQSQPFSVKYLVFNKCYINYHSLNFITVTIVVTAKRIKSLHFILTWHT